MRHFFLAGRNQRPQTHTHTHIPCVADVLKCNQHVDICAYGCDHTSVMQCGASLHQLGRAWGTWRRMSASAAGSHSCSAWTMLTNCEGGRRGGEGGQADTGTHDHQSVSQPGVKRRSLGHAHGQRT